ncbi:Cytochrome c oxidase subunit 6 [Stygiomarasmius scandens]|uniref:Cytochrome c oxidase subunit 6, mitochondrial n=1 Tax=Marasmiellus scandens TaxID=2682957 RepID=A0ABR1JTM0_9AGAR
MMRPVVANALRAAARPSFAVTASRVAPALTRQAHAQAQETFEQFTERYVAFFQQAEDLFELQRGLNNCFAHDLVPAPQVIEAAVHAARRVNDYSTAVRIFEGVKEKVESKAQYQAYLDELAGLRQELGISLKEELYPQSS